MVRRTVQLRKRGRRLDEFPSEAEGTTAGVRSGHAARGDLVFQSSTDDRARTLR